MSDRPFTGSSDSAASPPAAHSAARVQPYKVGLCYASVCAAADASPDEIAQAVNAEYPTGIASRWQVSGDPTFRSGEPNPCRCNDEPDARRHWLLEC